MSSTAAWRRISGLALQKSAVSLPKEDLAGSRIRLPLNKRKTDTDGKREEEDSALFSFWGGKQFLLDSFCH